MSSISSHPCTPVQKENDSERPRYSKDFRVLRSRVQGFGFWVLGFGLWALGFGFWVLGFGFWVLGFGLGFWVLGLGFRV